MRISILLATQNAHKRLELEALLEQWQSNQRQSKPGQPLSITLVNAPETIDIAETGKTFAENALIKAIGYLRALQGLTGNDDDTKTADFILAEDSGVIIPALDGTAGLSPFPGVVSKRWLSDTLQHKLLGKPSKAEDTNDPEAIKQPTAIDQKDLNAAILSLMKGGTDRRASYHCAMALISTGTSPETLLQTEGEMPLLVGGKAKGNGGFGYDPIMYPDPELLKGFSGNGEETIHSQTIAELSATLKNRISHRGKAFHQLLDRLVEQQSTLSKN